MTTIQWFPGHMAKARRQVEEKIKKVDMVLELLDARLPLSSRNPLIDRLVGHRPRILLMMKSDLADDAVTDGSIRYFRGRDVEAMPIDVGNRRQVGEIPRIANRLLEQKKAALERKGIRFHRIRAMVLGIPNVGKSTLINRLAGRSAAKTGDRPGVTRGQQWIRVGNTMEILGHPWHFMAKIGRSSCRAPSGCQRGDPGRDFAEGRCGPLFAPLFARALPGASPGAISPGGISLGGRRRSAGGSGPSQRLHR